MTSPKKPPTITLLATWPMSANPAVLYVTLAKTASNFVSKRRERVWRGTFQAGTSPSILSLPETIPQG